MNGILLRVYRRVKRPNANINNEIFHHFVTNNTTWASLDASDAPLSSFAPCNNINFLSVNRKAILVLLQLILVLGKEFVKKVCQASFFL